ncbi:C-type lectin domain family 17, member A-like [Penaeus indicus]|uniref:C-type lectin domain family 17, member A-like n=1 Tax=Penaeus indicus TaxID=29960 RepID=UPI00300C1BD2
MRFFVSLVWVAVVCTAESSIPRSSDVQRLGKLLADLLTEIRDAFGCHTVTRCPPNFHDADGTCLYLDKTRHSSWVAARHVCFNLGGDLAVFPDANAFASALRYINGVVTKGADEVPYIYVGGSDEEEEGVWRWRSGEPMPVGAPFWGSSKMPGKSKQPDGERLQNCAALNKGDQYYMHDGECDLLASALCQI